MSISMDSFTWQVAATFCAAAGAVAVGWRQVGIARLQADISKSSMEIARAQAFTARLAQRIALFEKRFAVYQAVQAYISLSLAKSGLTLSQGDQEYQEDQTKIWKARHQSYFLFSEKTRQSIDEACDLADAFVATNGQQSLFPSPEEDKRMKRERQAARLELISVLKNLNGRMRDEMAVTESDATIRY
jgi:hypothetical protein